MWRTLLALQSIEVNLGVQLKLIHPEALFREGESVHTETRSLHWLYFSGGATALRTAPLSAPPAPSGLLTLVTSARATTKARQSVLSKILPPNSLDNTFVVITINQYCALKVRPYALSRNLAFLLFLHLPRHQLGVWLSPDPLRAFLVFCPSPSR